MYDLGMWRKGSKTLREEWKQVKQSRGLVRAVRSGAGPRFIQTRLDRWSGRRNGRYLPAGLRGARGGGADEGGLAVAWREFAVRTAKSSR